MASQFAIAVLGVLAFIELSNAGGGGGGDKKVIIHVPFKVKTVHHTHTVVKHVDHGGGDKEYYKVIGYSGGIDDGHEVEQHGGGGGGHGGWGGFGGGFGGGHAESLESSQGGGDIGGHTSGSNVELNSGGYDGGFEGGHAGLEQASSMDAYNSGGDVGGGDYGGGYAAAQSADFGNQAEGSYEGYGGEQGGYE